MHMIRRLKGCFTPAVDESAEGRIVNDLVRNAQSNGNSTTVEDCGLDKKKTTSGGRFFGFSFHRKELL
uniref:Uncharacterized protein n=1 Tax=Ficus carica TaxID=3494 RepID=A0AA88EF90_FICCA|nr:hypothetical protein TIFTF001_055302 [Ficus carica]GMN72958.1 hypothetical protein TIFTF001_055304 [Ficus carica]